MKEKLIFIRKNNRYTQRQLADIWGISYSLYQKIEYGLRKAPHKNFDALAKALNITVDELLKCLEQ